MSAEPDIFMVLSCTHRTAPLAARERLAIPEEKLDTFYARLRAVPGVAETVVVSTCNRVEIYAAGSCAEAQLRETLAREHALDAAEIAAYCEWRSGLPAVEHLFQVAAGVDSQMVGEGEILGQVKEAYATALARRTTGAVLNRTFQKSFQAAAWVRTNTGIGQGQVSIGNVAVELATRIFGELGSSRVLVLGTGEVGRKTAQSFASRGAGGLTVASRTFEKARTLAGEIGGGAVDLAAALGSLERHDVLVGSATVRQPLVDLATLRRAVAARRGDPLFLIDLGLPRNFPPEASALPGVYLYNLDDLSAIANENLRHRLAEVEKARGILAQRAAQLWGKLWRSESA